MLKVVGASWVRTRVSTYIIGGMLVLAICAFFLADIERPQYDGTYCATALWSKMGHFSIEYWGQQLDLQSVPQGAARICYKDSIFKNGWAQIEIESRADYPDHVQAYAAGLLEGALSWGNIYSHYSNTVEPYCDETEDSKLFCTWVRKFLADNYQSIMDSGKIKGMNHNQDHYWYQIRLFYNQLQGMANGFAKGAKRSRSDYVIRFTDFLLMNSWSDLKDLRGYYDHFVMNGTNERTEEVESDVRGSMLLKIQPVNGTGQMLFGHSSAGSYSTMIRILKKYRLQYHISSETISPRVPGTDIEFTGYPGTIGSMDDFYIVSGEHVKLAIGGVEMTYKNETLWKVLELENSVFLSARLMSANRLCHSGRSWARIMSRHPDTGSKQWIVADMTRFMFTKLAEAEPSNTSVTGDDDAVNEIETESEEQQPIIAKYHKGTFWIVDQIPGRLHAEDETVDIFQNGFWASNGFPYFQETYELSGITGVPRAFPLQLHKNITESKNMIQVLKQRAVRGDLLPGDNKSATGNIDIKVFTETINGQSTFQAIAGPLYSAESSHPPRQAAASSALPLPSLSQLTSSEHEDHDDDDNFNYDDDKFHPRKITVREDLGAGAASAKSRPFRWSSSNLDEDHFGQPDIWNFDSFSPKWAWTGRNGASDLNLIN